MKQINTSVDSKKSVSHTALIFCNSILNAGTASDQYIKDNMGNNLIFQNFKLKDFLRMGIKESTLG